MTRTDALMLAREHAASHGEASDLLEADAHLTEAEPGYQPTPGPWWVVPLSSRGVRVGYSRAVVVCSVSRRATTITYGE